MTKYKIIVEEGIYHVTQRAPGKELLFVEEKDYLRFLSLLKETAEKFRINIFCFALLPNHLHILLKIKEKNLDKGMKFLFQSYAQYFNKKYQRKGHVFCGNYRIAFCDNDYYLLAISLYIHLNPFKARLTPELFNYRWYSLVPYIKNIKTTFLDVAFILSLLGTNLERARNIYKQLLEKTNTLEYESILKSSKAILNFFNNFSRAIKESKLVYYLRNLTNAPWDELERKIEEFRGKKWIKKPSERKALNYLVSQLLSSGYTIKEISQKIGLHRTTIYRLIQTQHKCS